MLDQGKRVAKDEAPGPDGMPSNAFKSLLPCMAVRLHQIIAASCQEGILPGQWRGGTVAPSTKTISRIFCRLQAYLMCHGAKLFERCVCARS